MAFRFRAARDVVRSAHRLSTDCDGMAQVVGPFRVLTVIYSNGEGWEHVSVSTPGRCPNWDEMCFVKRLFWDAGDVVMQLHPADDENYVNQFRYCLHLWRPIDQTIPQPPKALV